MKMEIAIAMKKISCKMCLRHNVHFREDPEGEEKKNDGKNK